MSLLRKILGIEKGSYDRPNQPWVCGHACDGHSCQLGPDKKGKCQAGGECLPRRQGARWLCTRTPEFGGPCSGGPNPDGTCGCVTPPCQPIRTLRSRRGLFCLAAVAVTLGFLLFALGGRAPDSWISPGKLTAAHATSEATCADCHAIAPGEVASGMGRLIANHPATSTRCLACHDLGAQPILPHGRAPDQFSSKHPGSTPTINSETLLMHAAKIARAPLANQRIDCTACHKEHQGRAADIRMIDNNQCQVCHQTAFKSFADGHPGFGNYPYKRRTRIIFDHASHLQKHFLDPANSARAPASCLDCHTPADSQGKMLVKSFAQTCAACHEAQIKGDGRAGAKGIAFFRVPGLDIKTLAAKGHSVGQWPVYAEGPVNPFIKLLLSSDKKATDDLAAIEGIDPLDLTSASASQLDAVDRTAWRIKSLFFDLATEGQAALISRLNKISGKSELTPAMLAQLPVDTLLAAKAAWWPDLFVEVPNYRKGILPTLPATAQPADKPVASLPKPAAPSAPGDDILGDDTPVAKPSVPAKPAPVGDDILGGDDLAAPAAKPTAAAPAKKPATDDILGDDILATAPAAAPAKKSAPQDDILGDLGADSAPAPEKKSPPAAPVVTVADAETWVADGGWYRSDDTSTLYYRPGGHADPFIKAWIDAAGSSTGSASAIVFKTIADPKGPGLCAKCHSSDPLPEGRHEMQWHPARFDPHNHEATKFNHSAHFSLLDQRGCQTCHVIAPQADYAASYADGTPAGIYHSNFRALSKDTCAACHQNKIAGDSCQLCHNYHQGVFATDKLPTASTHVEPVAPAKSADSP